jgi:Tol biopolymer transport system component
MALKEIDAGDPKFENYGMLSQDKKCVVSTTVSATWTIGENETKNPKSHIIVIEKASKHVKLDFSFAGEVQGAALSPDNHAVVFGNQGQIWWLDVGNSNAQILIKFRENARFPQFSPDGKNVYFIQDTSSGTVFFVLDLASKSIVQAFKGLNPVSAFSLSPDGKSIVFASTNEVRPQSEYVGCIWLLDIETGKVKRLTDRGTDQYPSFSPNGRWISFQRQQGLYLDSDLKAFNVVVMPYEPDTK